MLVGCLYITFADTHHVCGSDCHFFLPAAIRILILHLPELGYKRRNLHARVLPGTGF